MTSRVRCSCGRIYDPVKHPACPDCGAESAVESVVVAEKVKAPTPPETESAPSPPNAFINSASKSLRSLRMPVMIGGAILFLLVLFLVFRHSGSTGSAQNAVRPSVARYLGSPVNLRTLASEGLALPSEVVAQVAGAPYSAGITPPFAPAAACHGQARRCPHFGRHG